MNRTLGEALIARLRNTQAVLRSNPNHVPSGPHGGEFAKGAAGAGKHAAKRARRRKKRLKELEQYRKDGHQDIAELRVQHRKDRKELVRDQAKEWKRLRREHLKERNALRREHRKDKTSKADRRAAHAERRADHAHERWSMHEDHLTERAGMREDQHDDRRETIDKWVSDIRYEFPKSRTGRPREGADGGPARSAPAPAGPDLDLARAVPPQTARLSRRTTNKAGTAEAILSHCLRRRGWTARFGRGELTGAERLRLLGDVRLYGRSWLRHEAEAFFAAYRLDDLVSPDSGHRGLPVGAAPEVLGIERGLTGRIGSALSRFFGRARSFIHELILAGSMALRGPEPLSNDEVAYLDGQARVQAEYLARFEAEVTSSPPIALAGSQGPSGAFVTVPAKPPMSPAQFAARIEQYANSAHQAAQTMVRQSVQRLALPAPPAQLGLPAPAGPEERRVLGHPRTHHCHDCPPLAARGWQPLGSLPEIGETECGGLCLCTFEYRNLPGAVKPTVNGTAPVKPLRKIKLKTTPYTEDKRLKRPETTEDAAAKAKLLADLAARTEAARVKAEAAAAAPKGPSVLELVNPAPTDAEIAHEVGEYLAGRPSRLTVKNVQARPPAPVVIVPDDYETFE